MYIWVADALLGAGALRPLERPPRPDLLLLLLLLTTLPPPCRLATIGHRLQQKLPHYPFAELHLLLPCVLVQLLLALPRPLPGHQLCLQVA